MKINMDWYGLYLRAYNINVTDLGKTEVTFEMITPAATTEPQLDKLARDISLLNAIRAHGDPTVKDQFEALLTTIALTNDRNVPEVKDSMAKTARVSKTN